MQRLQIDPQPGFEIYHTFRRVPLQNLSGIKELVGSDVNLVHRLLKNRISEATGWKAYILFTDAAIAQMNVKLENPHEQIESYEHLGEVKTFNMDLHERYKELKEAQRVFVSPEEADWVSTRTIPAHPYVAWEWMNDIQKRLLWETFHDIHPLLRPGGHIGLGAQNHCAHGKNAFVETIVDWHPFKRPRLIQVWLTCHGILRIMAKRLRYIST